jgi:hypothetical protein
MSACRCLAPLALLGSAASAATAAPPGAGRLEILARESADAAGAWLTADAAGAPVWALVALAVLLPLAAFAGAYVGLRRYTFCRVREHDGWREITYRFRSAPVTIRGETWGKMTGLLAELEKLGGDLSAGDPRRALAADADAVPEPMPEPASAETVSPVADTPAPEESPAVTFARRPRGRRARPAAALAPATTGPAREQRYREARRLLSQGHDPDTVRALTGLKTAEVDLLRWVPETETTAGTAATGEAR